MCKPAEHTEKRCRQIARCDSNAGRLRHKTWLQTQKGTKGDCKSALWELEALGAFPCREKDREESLPKRME